jgi:SAM-dependent methyltransferase
MKWLLKRLIVRSQRWPRFAGRGGYTGDAAPPAAGEFPQAATEYADHAAFLDNFRGAGLDVLASLRDRVVLDFGSGYGGRTVWYAEHARAAYGVEPFESVVRRSNEFARARGAGNCEFRVGSETRIDFPDAFFDLVISYDVLEHVRRPDAILPEMRRVLRPGGLLFLVFTPYYGMFAHHLNYVTMLPGLHWLFGPRTIVAAVNELIAEEPAIRRLGVSAQPAPSRSFDGRRDVLPTLNGISRRQYLGIMRAIGMEPLFLRATPILEKFPVGGGLGTRVNQLLCAVPGLDEAFAHNLVSVYRRP